MINKMFILLFVLVATVIASDASPVEPYDVASRQGSLNRYFIYTRHNVREPLEIDLSDLSAATAILDPAKITVVLVHGHRESFVSTLHPTVKDALLTSEDVNVIVVDWSVYASQIYTNAVAAVPSVGVHIASVIKQLSTAGSITSLHLVGFDLGAHVVGFTGRYTGNVDRITGLDPSARQWGANSFRLNKNDAYYVEVIHTNGGFGGNGIGTSIGQVDFFVNGGRNQPGCLWNNDCSHKRAVELFAATLIVDHLIGVQCNNWLQVIFNTCRGMQMSLGKNHLFKIGTGMFRVNTKREFPF